MNRIILMVISAVGLVALFSLINVYNLTGMASQRHIFLSESICGDADSIPVISKVSGPGRPHTFIYECIPRGEKIVVPTGKFNLDERQKTRRNNYYYIHKPEIR